MLTTMARSRKPGRRADPDSKRSQGVDRHVSPRLAFHLSEELLAALDRYIGVTRPMPSYTSVLVLALEEFLTRQGQWPLSTEE